MLRVLLSCVFALSLLRAADELAKPEKLSLHTWLREDLFAGWIADDAATFDRGVKKLDRFLADHPDDTDGLSWKYFVVSYDVLKDLRTGNNAAYARHLAATKELRARIFKAAPNSVTGCIIVGSSLVRIAALAPEPDRGWMFKDGRELLARVPELQGKAFDTLPPHLRGELWAQLAFAADRLGDTAERDKLLEIMRTKLEGTPYESRAKSWQKPGNMAKEKEYTCMSCHDPGRLAPTLARLGSQ